VRLLRAAGATVVAAALPLAYACTIVNRLSVPPPDAGPEGGADAADTGAPDVFDGCEHRRAPPRPQIPDDDGSLGFLVAVRAIHVQAAMGYDLDNACTCAPHDPTCASPVQTCDGEGGVDNAVGVFMTNLGLAAPFEQQMTDAIIGAGRGGVLFQVEKYNGQLDDANVKVSIYSSQGPATIAADGGIVHHPPDFTKVDTWTVDRSRLTSGQPPGTYDATTEAYVSNGVLVTPFVALVRLSETVQLATTGAYLVAPIDLSDPAHPLIRSGVIAGRWPTDKLLALIEGTMCSVPQTVARDGVCASADIMRDEGQDKQGLPCNALSLALGFDAVPALFGPPQDLGPSTAPCLDGGPVLLCPQ
jgi:hypothetical protein